MAGLTHAEADHLLTVLQYGVLLAFGVTLLCGYFAMRKPRHVVKSDARRVDRPVPSMRCLDDRQLARALDALDLRRLRDEQDRVACEQRKFRLIIGGSTRERIH